MKSNFETESPFEVLFLEFALGLVLTPYLTYPFTNHLLIEYWANLSLEAGVAWLCSAWIFVTAYVVQPFRDRWM